MVFHDNITNLCFYETLPLKITSIFNDHALRIFAFKKYILPLNINVNFTNGDHYSKPNRVY